MMAIPVIQVDHLMVYSMMGVASTPKKSFFHANDERATLARSNQ